MDHEERLRKALRRQDITFWVSMLSLVVGTVLIIVGQVIGVVAGS